MKKGQIITTSLWDDILSVVQTSDRSRTLVLEAIIHTEKDDFAPMKVLLLENKRDYYKETGESFHIRVIMTFGDYVYRVLPFKDHLELSVITTWAKNSGEFDEERPPKEIRYKALLDTTKNPFFGSQSLQNKDNFELNLLPPQEIVFELVDRKEELLRLKEVSGTFLNVTNEQILRGLFYYEANKIKVDGKNLIEMIELDPPDNKQTIPDLLIPSGTLLRDIPGYLQQEAQGVYSAGIGSFYQLYRDLPSWFVFPLYRPERFDEDRFKMVIYAVPEEKMPHHDHTFRSEGKITYIVTTGAKHEVDNARMSELNTGVGFRMADAESFMKKPVEVLPDGIKANRNRLNYELQNHERKDQVLYASPKEISSNPFIHYSRILGEGMTLLTLSWENSDPDLIYPGMPVKYVTMDKGNYLERRGTLVKAMTITSIQGNPSPDASYRCNTQLVMFLERKPDEPENDEYVVEEKKW